MKYVNIYAVMNHLGGSALGIVGGLAVLALTWFAAQGMVTSVLGLDVTMGTVIAALVVGKFVLKLALVVVFGGVYGGVYAIAWGADQAREAWQLASTARKVA